MKQRILGSTGLKASVIGVGTWQFGGEWGLDYTQPQVDAIFDAARETGINLIDTAECYGDHLSEKFVGEAIRRDRDNWILATKFGHHFHDLFDRTTDWSPEDVVRQLDASLEALQTDYVDLYQFHSGPDEAFETEGLWEALAREKAKGKIRHLGVSIGGPNSYQTGKASAVGAETIQVVYNRLETKPEEEVLPLCEKHRLGVLARVPLASGYLSGKYKPGDEFPKNDVRSHWGGNRDEKIAQALEIRDREVPDDVNMAQWALAWCLRNAVVTTVIPGCKNPEQVRSNAAAADLLDHLRFAT